MVTLANLNIDYIKSISQDEMVAHYTGHGVMTEDEAKAIYAQVVPPEPKGKTKSAVSGGTAE